MIKREQYLSKIREFYSSDIIKVIIGIRRCGKSVLLNQIKEEIIENGIDEDHIIFLNFEDVEYSFISDYMDLHKFIKENEVKTDYEKGVFLHLLTDKIFFNEFFPKEYLEKENYVQFCKNLYTSYEMTNPYIAKKYNIKFSKELLEKIKQNIEDNSKKKHIEGKEGHNIIPIDKLEEFIEQMSDISIEDYLKREGKQT